MNAPSPIAPSPRASRFLRSLGLAGLAGTALALGALPAAAQKSKLPRNAPENCPYCEGDPARMQAAGIVSHGGFDFCTTNTAEVDRLFGGKDILWIESAHFELGMVLGPYTVGNDDAKKVRAELEELALVLPEVDPKTRRLDPWLRMHLYAQRVEKVWQRFLELMGRKESDFPDGRSVWLLGTPYFGEGPYAGQKGKYEVIVLPTAADQITLGREHFGLSVKRTQRWNVVDRDSLVVITNIAENELRGDQQLHGHLAFNLTANLFDGYKHYSYDVMRWLQEGLAHFVEREINPRFNTFDASEGSDGVRVNKEDWDTEVRKLIQSGKAPRVAELSALRTFAEFQLPHHYAVWSMTKFMIETNPTGYACLQDRLHGRKREDGTPDGQALPDVQRAAFQECLGMNYAQFDEAWQAWALGSPSR